MAAPTAKHSAQVCEFFPQPLYEKRTYRSLLVEPRCLLLQPGRDGWISSVPSPGREDSGVCLSVAPSSPKGTARRTSHKMHMRRVHLLDNSALAVRPYSSHRPSSRANRKYRRTLELGLRSPEIADVARPAKTRLHSQNGVHQFERDSKRLQHRSKQYGRICRLQRLSSLSIQVSEKPTLCPAHLPPLRHRY